MARDEGQGVNQPAGDRHGETMTCIISEGAIVCGTPERDEFPRDGVVCVGFGSSGLYRDGECVVDGEARASDEGDDRGPLTGEECERIAAADPGHKWEIVKHGPLSGATWQREGVEVGRWFATEKNGGFA